MKQAILGASGNIGGLLLQELLNRSIGVKALARNWREHYRADSVEYVSVDAEDFAALKGASNDVDVLYVALALPYSIAIWKQHWPVVMRNVIAAAKANKFKIVFLDNVYMYGLVKGAMTEETPVNPCSEKGMIRAEIADMLLTAIKAGAVTATIGRSADYYGPHTRISDRFFNEAYSNALAVWPGNTAVLRTFNFTHDNARALAILGNDSRADQQIWHLPASPAMKGTEFIDLAGTILGRRLKVTPIPGSSQAEKAAYRKQSPELVEMLYQYENDYVFDSSKFQKTFKLQPTSYENGFRRIFDLLAAEDIS